MRVPASRRLPRFPIVNSVLCVSLLAALPASTVLAEDPRCAADVDSDGGIGAADLSAVLAAWGTVASPGSPLDINGDGSVAGADLTAVLVGWSAGVDCSAGGLDWATVIEASPDPEVIYGATLRERIVATGLPWRVRDNGTNIETMLIPPGEFDMGCGPVGCPDQLFCLNDDRPAHHVTLPKAYYIGRHEVTQAEWLTKMPTNPSATQGPNNPVENISWNTAKAFLDASGLRFATEAEWEYACRAGTTTAYHGT